MLGFFTTATPISNTRRESTKEFNKTRKRREKDYEQVASKAIKFGDGSTWDYHWKEARLGAKD